MGGARISGMRAFAGFLIIAFLLCATITYTRSQDFLTGKNSLNWPSISGQVVLSKVVIGCKRRGFEPAVSYAYNVNGHSYRGYRINLWPDGCTSQESAQTVVDQYPKGPTNVRYDPRDPSNSSLEVGLPRGALLRVIELGVLCALLLALVIICLVLDARK